MNLKVGQKVFVKDGFGLKNIYGYVIKEEYIENKYYGALLQLLS